MFESVVLVVFRGGAGGVVALVGVGVATQASLLEQPLIRPAS